MARRRPRQGASRTARRECLRPRASCVFSIPVPDSRPFVAAPRINSRSPDVPNSLVAGKNAGNFADLAVFCGNPSRKHMRIQRFANEFPARSSREFIRPSRELRRRPETTESQPPLRHARLRAGHPGGTFGDYAADAGLDARVRPAHDETETVALIFGRRPSERLRSRIDWRSDGGTPVPISVLHRAISKYLGAPAFQRNSALERRPKTTESGGFRVKGL